MLAVGVINYSNILTYTALNRNIEVLAKIEYARNNIDKSLSKHLDKVLNSKIGEIYYDDRSNPNIEYGDEIKLKKSLVKPELIYSQPASSIIVDDFEFVYNLTSSVKPKYYLFVSVYKNPLELISVLEKYKNYRWTIIRVSSCKFGLPVKATYNIIIGSLMKLSPQLFNIESETENVKTWDCIKDLANLRQNLSGHTLLKQKGFFNKIVWESCSILNPSQNLWNLPQEQYPETLKEYNKLGKNIFKSHFPYRLDKNGLVCGVPGVPKYIHPTENRPLTPRELARILGLSDEFPLSKHENKNLRILSNIIPPKICNYAFDLIDQVEKGECADNPVYVDLTK